MERKNHKKNKTLFSALRDRPKYSLTKEIAPTSSLTRGLKMKVPKPEPHTAMPVAKERLFSK